MIYCVTAKNIKHSWFERLPDSSTPRGVPGLQPPSSLPFKYSWSERLPDSATPTSLPHAPPAAQNTLRPLLPLVLFLGLGFFQHLPAGLLSSISAPLRKPTCQRNSCDPSFLESLECHPGYEASMLTIHITRTFNGCWSSGETKLSKAASRDSPHSLFMIKNITSHSSLVNGSLSCNKEFRGDCLLKTPKWTKNRRLLLPLSASFDEDYRSSRNIAISLFRRYRNAVDRGGTKNLKEFISAGVNAYALGCTEEGLRKELISLKESGIEIEGLPAYGGNTSLKYKICSQEIQECILWLSVIFITILCTPQPTVIRWSSTPPVSDEVMAQWKGFCALIANAYYMKGMAWLPVRTLQLEQLAVMGHAEELSVVASRMQLVFSTLEVVSPQWPKV